MLADKIVIVDCRRATGRKGEQDVVIGTGDSIAGDGAIEFTDARPRWKKLLPLAIWISLSVMVTDSIPVPPGP